MSVAHLLTLTDHLCGSILGMCRRLGRVQPFVPSLLHEPLDQAEQPLPTLPTRLDRAEAWKITFVGEGLERLLNTFKFQTESIPLSYKNIITSAVWRMDFVLHFGGLV